MDQNDVSELALMIIEGGAPPCIPTNQIADEVEVRLRLAEPAEEVLVSPLKNERPCCIEDRLFVLELECVRRILGSTLCDMEWRSSSGMGLCPRRYCCSSGTL